MGGLWLLPCVVPPPSVDLFAKEEGRGVEEEAGGLSSALSPLRRPWLGRELAPSRLCVLGDLGPAL